MSEPTPSPSAGFRPDCKRCHGAGWISGDEGGEVDCPACSKPLLSPALERLRAECQLWISAVDIGDCPEGILWQWRITDPGGKELSTALFCDDAFSL